MINEKIPLSQWFTASYSEILDKFSELNDARRVGSGLEQFVYVPGTRKDRVLLVAHSDTVFDHLDGTNDIYPVYNNYTIRGSVKSKTGLGADDRAGCAMLWALKDLGHSLFIPNGEESGCVGTRFAMEQDWFEKEVDKHQFALEFDRCNDKDIVTYRVGTKDFVYFLEQELSGYTHASGSFTDIGVICPDKICGANISVGYYNQHRNIETLKMKEWWNTFLQVRRMLTKQNLPKFKHTSPKEPEGYTFRDIYAEEDCTTVEILNTHNRPSGRLITDVVLSCPNCESVLTVAEAVNGCIYCDETNIIDSSEL